jgi:DNA-binding CsgD family transcriptional regulator/tetratricopeptide (TPR) repeat protein
MASAAPFCEHRQVAVDLAERATELRALDHALDAAVAGEGSVVLVSGEAGIGKSSVLRSFLRAAGGRARSFVGACDDLLTPRAFGPLRDIGRQTGGALATALAGDDRESVFAAVLDVLAQAPTVCAVEDAHWADEATLDVLRHVGRRIVDLPAVLVITYRDDELGAGHALLPVLGSLPAASTRRLVLGSLSAAAVAGMTDGSGLDAAALHQLTGGNPFFVSEVLAADGSGGVPDTVVDAVLARLHRLAPATQHALEQLSVVPSGTELSLARALLPDIAVLAEAEHSGMLEVAPRAVRFRHELARRAVVGSLPVSRRMQLNAEVLARLRAVAEPELARLVHHAVEAGDAEAVVEFAPRAAEQARATGAMRAAAELYGHALERRALLEPAAQAGLYEAYASILFNSDRRAEAIAAAAAAVTLREQAGDPARLGQALATLALQQWSDLQIEPALAAARRAVALFENAPDSPQQAFALVQLGVLLVNLDRDEEALAVLDAGVGAADRLGVVRWQIRGHLYRGRARAHTGDHAGIEEVVDALAAAKTGDDVEHRMLGYLNIASVLWRLGRYEELERTLAEAEEFGRTRDFLTHTRASQAFGLRLRALRGEWAAAEEGLRWVLAADNTGGMLGRQALPTLAMLAIRQGRDDATEVAAAARDNAVRSQNLHALVPMAVALAERGWLTGAPGDGELARSLLPALELRGRERERGEVLRWLKRLGDPVGAFPGCPQEYAAGLRGDWRAAAAAWAAIGAPYERALELVESGEPEPMLEGLAQLDALGAAPAAAWTRRRLRERGQTQIPRGPQAGTRANPAGLTGRQLEILRLLSMGLTNAEIAARLVLSVRTVDHHVSAVLAKLGVATRAEAAAAARTLDAS